MVPVHHRARLAVAASLALVGVAGTGCDPSPTFPAPAQPLVGRVLFERELTTGTEPIDLRTYAASFHIDPGTVPVGTKLVVRILDGIVKDLPGGTAGDVWNVDGQPTAVQLLCDATFARPVVLTVPNFVANGGNPDVLHGDESAAPWARVGQATPGQPPKDFGFSAELTEPHLWSLATPPPPGTPQGRYRLDRLVCGTRDAIPIPEETLEIDGPRYVWTRVSASDGCASVERGAIVLDVVNTWATFTPDDGAPYAFELQLEASNAFALKAAEPRPRECPADAVATLSFLRSVDATDAGAPPEASDGGCARDDGGSGDAAGG